MWFAKAKRGLGGLAERRGVEKSTRDRKRGDRDSIHNPLLEEARSRTLSVTR